jgi:hypothetical protein
MQDSENNKGCLLLNFIVGYMHELYTFLTPAFTFILHVGEEHQRGRGSNKIVGRETNNNKIF